MLVNLTDKVKVKVLEGDILPAMPRLEIRTMIIRITAITFPQEYHKLFAHTVGTHKEFSDYVFRFDKTSQMLKSLTLFSPTSMSSQKGVFDTWLGQPPINGSLQITEPANFEMMTLEMDYEMDRESEAFICSVAFPKESSGNKLRLRIAQDFDLLFYDEQFYGWILWNSLRYIVSQWDMPHDYQPDSQLVDIVYDYLQLVSVPSFDRVDCQDPGILREFLNLRDLLSRSKETSYQRQVVREAIEDILDFFYDDWDDSS